MNGCHHVRQGGIAKVQHGNVRSRTANVKLFADTVVTGEDTLRFGK
jgi:hypothetical protein